MQIGVNSPLKNRIDAGALFTVMALWGLHLAYPMNILQNARWMLLGYAVPVYFFFTIGLITSAAVGALALKRHWLRWELLWWSLPLICLPGLLSSADPLWSARQGMSWIVRGVLPGGVIFVTTPRQRANSIILCWIYPIVIAASLLGLNEIYTSHNPLWDDFNHSIQMTSQPANPFYRPTDAILGSLPPRGTQGNRIPYASTLIGFLPLGIWLLKYKKRFYAANLFAVGALASILLLAQVRSTWLAILATLLLMPAVGLLRTRREAIRIIAGALLCIGVFMAIPKTHALLGSRLNSFHLTQTSIKERLAVLHTAAVLKDHWLLGVGFGQFPMACKSYYPPAMIWLGTPDNQYLRWAIENGIPSTILFAVFLIGLVRAGWNKILRMKDVQEADFYKSLLVGWIGVCVTFLFFDGFYWGACNMTFWSLLGIFATCLKPESATLQ
jgi:hypothetical protein